MRIYPLGDRAVVVQLADEIGDSAHRRVRAALARLDALAPPGVEDVVPTFTTLAVHYDPARIAGTRAVPPHLRLADALAAALAGLDDGATAEPLRTVEIPVCYGGEAGPDLEKVAQLHGLSPDEVVRRHAEAGYRVYMVGFVPGFAYLGGLAPELATPRRATPRERVPAGSVGIGGSQTGVYPQDSPGGWWLIGRTPLELFDPGREPAALLSLGDAVRFVPLSPAECRAWERP